MVCLPTHNCLIHKHRGSTSFPQVPGFIRIKSWGAMSTLADSSPWARSSPWDVWSAGSGSVTHKHMLRDTSECEYGPKALFWLILDSDWMMSRSCLFPEPNNISDDSHGKVWRTLQYTHTLPEWSGVTRSCLQCVRYLRPHHSTCDYTDWSKQRKVPAVNVKDATQSIKCISLPVL